MSLCIGVEAVNWVYGPSLASPWFDLMADTFLPDGRTLFWLDQLLTSFASS